MFLSHEESAFSWKEHCMLPWDSTDCDHPNSSLEQASFTPLCQGLTSHPGAVPAEKLRGTGLLPPCQAEQAQGVWAELGLAMAVSLWGWGLPAARSPSVCSSALSSLLCYWGEMKFRAALFCLQLVEISLKGESQMKQRQTKHFTWIFL